MAIRFQVRISVALGETASIISKHQRDVPPSWNGKVERTIEQCLPRCGRQEVIAAHDIRDALSRIVHDTAS